MTNISFSIFHNLSGLMAKHITLSADGTLSKTSAAHMWKGRVETRTTALADLPAILDGLSPRAAIGLGVCDRAPADIVTTAALPSHPEAVARTQEYFHMPDGPALGFVDCDTGATAEDLISALTAAFPAFETAEKLVVSSASAGISLVDSQQPISESKGLHLYFTMRCGKDFKRFGEVLCKRLWLAGFGHIEVSEDGKMLVKQLVDKATFAPERIIFEAAPDLGAGLKRCSPDPQFLSGESLDTSGCPDLTPEEDARYEALVATAKDAKQPEAHAIWEEYKLRRGLEISRKQGIAIEKAIETIVSARENRSIKGGFPLHFEAFGEVTVTDVLKDIEKYDEHSLLDPMEPNYKSRFCAIFYANIGQVPCIHSFAHGGQTYFIEKPDHRLDGRSKTSPINGEKGGRPRAPNHTETARKFMQDTLMRDGFPIVRHYQDEWYEFSDMGWATVTDDEMMKRLMTWLQSQDGELPHYVTINYGRNVLANLFAFSLCGLPAALDRPCWLSTQEDARNTIAFSNRLAVDVWRYAEALNNDRSVDDCIRPVTADLFSGDFVDYPWSPGPSEPEMFLQYLRRVCPDEELRKAVQRMMGLMMADVTKYEVFFQLCGEGANGKTVLLEIIEKLVGSNNVSCIPLESLAPGTRFQSFPLATAKVNITGELRTDTGSATLASIEGVFKNAVSGGKIEIERKGIDKIERRCRARFLMSGNSLPTFVDKTDAIWRRLRILPFEVQIPEAERDVDLARNIIGTELPSIARWALQGLADVIQMGRMPDCQRGGELKTAHRTTCDHEREFLMDNYEVGTRADRMKTGDMYSLYSCYMSSNGYRPLGQAKFKSRIRSLCPSAEFADMRIDGQVYKCVAGLKIRDRTVADVADVVLACDEPNTKMLVGFPFTKIAPATSATNSSSPRARELGAVIDIAS